MKKRTKVQKVKRRKVTFLYEDPNARDVVLMGDFGKITLPQVLGINRWIIIFIFIIGGSALFYWFEKKGL